MPAVAQEGELIERALGPAGGDRNAALRELIVYLEPVIRRRANWILELRGDATGLTRHEVQDLVQEVWEFLFARDFRVLRTWQPERGRNLRSFVGMVSMRRCLDVAQSRNFKPHREVSTPLDDLDRDIGLVESLEDRIVDRCFLEALISSMRKSLSADGERLLDLMYLEGASPQEAQQQTGLSMTKIYNVRRRIKNLATKLAEDLSRSPEFDPHPDRSLRGVGPT